MNKRDLTGKRFGRLVVLCDDGTRDKSRSVMWRCQCDCGNIVHVRTTSLTNKKRPTLSCGCLSKERTKEMWEDEDFRQMQSEKAKEQWENEDFKQMQSNRMKEVSKQLWQNEEFKQTHSDRMKEQWNNEEYRQMHSEQRRRMNEEMWKDEEFRQMHSDRMKELWKDEEFREAHTGENNAMYGVHRYGADSPNYNPSITDEERESRRHIQGYDEWCYKVKEQGNFICDCCGKESNGDLCSHHLDAYKWNKERRLDITNGVCLCEHCHKDFHSIYGSGDNTEEDYLEYKFAYQHN